MTENRRLFAALRPLVAGALVSACVLAGGAADRKARTGFFLSALGVQAGLGGDMDGKAVLDVGEETFLVPELKSAWGYGLSLGHRRDAFSQEISYYEIEHEAVWKDAVLKATSHWVEYIPRFYLSTRSALQPFASLGLSYMWLDAEDCASQGAQADDATFYGIGLNLSGGISIYVHPRLAVQGSGGYRVLMIGRVRSARGKAATIQETVWGDGPTFAGGLRLTF
ncbi:MAG: hypothetical protein JW742_09560 [Candidatus Aminicenantes bacterium]|nr:hypothetical protein [Candidatus Aminicenantes bacterium]